MVDRPDTPRGASGHGSIARTVVDLALVLLCLMLAACSGQAEGPSPSSPAVAPTTTQIAAATELGAVIWASEIDPVTSEPVARQDAFSRDEKHIYAVVETGPLAAGTTLTATWAFNAQAVEGVEVTVTADAARGAGWIEFHLEWSGAGLWPTGMLSVEITASTGESTRSTIEIQGT